MDPVTICLVLAAPVFFVICYVFFNMATRESTFEETYGKAALKLLNEDSNPKGKAKNGKAKKLGKTVEKKLTYDKSESLFGTTETTKTVTRTIEVFDELPEAPIPTSSTSPKTESVEAIDASQPSNVAESSKAKKNKKKNRKIDSFDFNSETVSKANDVQKKEESNGQDKNEQETPIQNTAYNASNGEKIRNKREVSETGAVNLDTFIERLSSTEIEPEYLTFLRQFSDQAKNNESKLNESILKLQRELSSKIHELEHLHDQLDDSQTNIAKIQSLESALKEAKEKHNLYVASVSPKLSENYQLRESLRKQEENMTAQSRTYTASMDKLKRDSEQIYNSMRTSLTQANDSLHQKELLIQDLEKAIQQNLNVVKEKESEFDGKDSIIEELRSHIQQKDRLIGEVEAEIKRKDTLLSNLNEEFKQKENYLIRDKDEQIKLANSKLEIELKESLQRIDELRSRNYKLVESINALYNHKTATNVDENKKPVAEGQELSA